MQMRVFGTSATETHDLGESVSHIEITMNGVRFTITPADEDGAIDLRITQTLGTTIVIEPFAGNAIRFRAKS